MALAVSIFGSWEAVPLAITRFLRKERHGCAALLAEDLRVEGGASVCGGVGRTGWLWRLDVGSGGT
jgi:hypothetical protein